MYNSETSNLSEEEDTDNHFSGIICIIRMKDGKVATGSLDNQIKLWDSNTNSLIKTLLGHTDLKTCLTTTTMEAKVLPQVGKEYKVNKNILVSGSLDMTIRIWDPETE